MLSAVWADFASLKNDKIYGKFFQKFGAAIQKQKSYWDAKSLQFLLQSILKNMYLKPGGRIQFKRDFSLMQWTQQGLMYAAANCSTCRVLIYHESLLLSHSLHEWNVNIVPSFSKTITLIGLCLEATEWVFPHNYFQQIENPWLSL